tara:strand:+ start:5736 stop:5843 length:108 start_codon:yes stop_codon:yes gene_type:complete
MTDELFRATLVTTPEEVREAERELDGRLDNGGRSG